MPEEPQVERALSDVGEGDRGEDAVEPYVSSQDIGERELEAEMGEGGVPERKAASSGSTERLAEDQPGAEEGEGWSEDPEEAGARGDR